MYALNIIVCYRVAKVVREMEAIQKREAEDTASLENMVQQVEANLRQTTVMYLATILTYCGFYKLLPKFILLSIIKP